jgi:opacity protein-like surface antigen
VRYQTEDVLEASREAQALAQLSAQTTATITALRAVGAAFATVGTPYLLKSETFDAANGKVITIEVKANTTYVAFLPDSAKKIQQARLGKYKVSVAPHESWHLSVSGGAIYSFVKNPSYSVQTTNNLLAISQTANDYNKVSGAVALNATPDIWFGEYFQPHLQIGIAPDSSKLAFLLGGGFTAGSIADLSFGAIYQKTTVLGAGLSVGQTVSTTQALKTSTEFKTGFYVGFGIKVK